jgi:hypothetical protein
MSAAAPAAPIKTVGIVYKNDSRSKTVSEVNKGRGGFGYVINSMLLVSIVGMCIKIFFSTDTSADGTSGPANAVIYGYGIVALAILIVMFISYGIHDRIDNIRTKLATKGNPNSLMGKLTNIIGFLKSFLTSSGPSILTITVLVWIISLNITHYKRINKGAVAKEFFQLSNGTTFLFVFQIICLFQYLKLFIEGETEPSKKKANEQAQGRIAFATYFITMINLIVVGMMTIILQFFSTDG